ncbi:MAG: hypothetical protein ABI343_18250 [Burkholderiaceae bacterium]
MNSDSQLQSSVLEEPQSHPSVNAAQIDVHAKGGAAWSAPGVVGTDIARGARSGVVAASHAGQRKILTLKKHR